MVILSVSLILNLNFMINDEKSCLQIDSFFGKNWDWSYIFKDTVSYVIIETKWKQK